MLKQVKKLSSHFANFEQVITKIVILLNLSKSKNYLLFVKNYFTDFEQVKKTNSKTPVGEAGCLCIAFFPPTLFSVTLPWTIARLLDPFYTFSPAHRRVIHNFTLHPAPPVIWMHMHLCIQFLNSHTHVTYRTPCHARRHLHSHSHSYLGKQRISLGVTINLGICLCPHT